MSTEKDDSYVASFASSLDDATALFRKKIEQDDIVTTNDDAFQKAFAEKLQEVLAPPAGSKIDTKCSDYQDRYAEVDQVILDLIGSAKEIFNCYDRACAKVEEAKPQENFGERWKADWDKLQRLLSACHRITKATVGARTGFRTSPDFSEKDMKSSKEEDMEQVTQDEIEAEQLLQLEDSTKSKPQVPTDINSLLTDLEKAMRLIIRHVSEDA